MSRANDVAGSDGPRPDPNAQPVHHQYQATHTLSRSNSLARPSDLSVIPSRRSLAPLRSMYQDDSHMPDVCGPDQSFVSNVRVRRSQSLTRKSDSSSAKEKRRLECPYCRKAYMVGGHFQNHLRDHRELRPWQHVLMDPPNHSELFQAPSTNLSSNMSQTSIASGRRRRSLHDTPDFPTSASPPGQQEFYFVDEDSPQRSHKADQQTRISVFPDVIQRATLDDYSTSFLDDLLREDPMHQ